jgi:hypothetical protein
VLIRLLADTGQRSTVFASDPPPAGTFSEKLNLAAFLATVVLAQDGVPQPFALERRNRRDRLSWPFPLV